MATELGGSVFEITRDLIGDLFRAKNAGVTTGWLEAVLNQLNRSTEGARWPTTPADFFYNQLQLC
jgi:hypothetical protein